MIKHQNDRKCVDNMGGSSWFHKERGYKNEGLHSDDSNLELAAGNTMMLRITKFAFNFTYCKQHFDDKIENNFDKTFMRIILDTKSIK